MKPAVRLTRADGTPSDKLCLCTLCAEAFTTDSLFDRHRIGRYAKLGELVGTRRCMTVEEMEAKGWSKNARSFWKGAPLSASKLAKLKQRTPATPALA